MLGQYSERMSVQEQIVGVLESDFWEGRVIEDFDLYSNNISNEFHRLEQAMTSEIPIERRGMDVSKTMGFRAMVPWIWIAGCRTVGPHIVERQCQRRLI